MNSLRIAKLIREYFEITLNSSVFAIDIKKSTATARGIVVDVLLRPYYGKGKKYTFLVNPIREEITDVQLVEEIL